MSDTHEEGRIRVRDGFSKAWGKMWQEKQTLALIGVLYALILTIAGWGTLSEQLDMIAEGDLSAASEPRAPSMADAIYYIAALLVGSAYYVSLTRLYITGRESVLDGGMATLAKRSLWVIWRYICAMVWALVILLPLGLAVGFIIGAVGDNAIGGLFMTMAFLGLIIAVMVFSAVVMAAVIDTSMDVSTNIRDAFKLLKGLRLRLGGMYIIISLLLGVLAIIGAGIVGAIFGSIIGTAAGLITFMITIYVLTTFMAYVLIGGIAETMTAIRDQHHVDIEA